MLVESFEIDVINGHGGSALPIAIAEMVVAPAARLKASIIRISVYEAVAEVTLPQEALVPHFAVPTDTAGATENGRAYVQVHAPRNILPYAELIAT